jgi:hypothetical protein
MADANICVSLAFSQDGSFISLFSDHRAGFPTKPPQRVAAVEIGSLRYCP